MCDACRAARSGPAPEPDELIVHANLREPYLQWGCPITGCDYWSELPWALQRHAAAEHPRWTAALQAPAEAQRADLWRVIYRRTADQGDG
jgi:hypothetical protein